MYADAGEGRAEFFSSADAVLSARERTAERYPKKTDAIFNNGAAATCGYREIGISSESISFCSFLIALGSFIES